MPTPPLSDEACLEALAALKEHGTVTEAALALNMPRATFQGRLKNARHRFGDQPLDQGHGNAPDGWRVKGTSTLFDADGVAKLQWVKTTADMERQRELMIASVEAMAADVRPVPPLDAPATSLPALATLYTFTDYHVGALCWHKEGGADWDVSIAKDMGERAMAALVAGSPASDTAIVNTQGDWMHYDGHAPVTPAHGHILDADSRFGRVVDVSIALIRQLCALALTKHPNVILHIAEGNHDLASSLWLRKLFGALYEMEPRLSVHDSELPYTAIQWGKTMLGFHHGHMRKNDQLPALFAAQFRSMWGDCPKVYIHTGHRHHKEDKEHSGCRVIQHPTLAARDAYAARGGWWSERAITAVSYHREFGEVGTVTVSPEMLAAA